MYSTTSARSCVVRFLCRSAGISEIGDFASASISLRLERAQEGVRVLERHLRRRLADEDALDDVALGRLDDPGLVVVADAGRGVQDRLVQRLLAQLLADLGQVGADFLALAVDDVAVGAGAVPWRRRACRLATLPFILTSSLIGGDAACCPCRPGAGTARRRRCLTSFHGRGVQHRAGGGLQVLVELLLLGQLDELQGAVLGLAPGRASPAGAAPGRAWRPGRSATAAAAPRRGRRCRSPATVASGDLHVLARQARLDERPAAASSSTPHRIDAELLARLLLGERQQLRDSAR